MLTTKPDYFDKFTCIASDCEDLCCAAGWQIVIDNKTMKRYKMFDAVHVDAKNQILNNINEKEKVFKQDKDGVCRFLNSNNLCKLYLNFGEEGFCKTCASYPRHTEEFENMREKSISISCPEAARILLNHVEPIEFIEEETDEYEEYGDFDLMLHSLLLDSRDAMFSIIQRRDLPIDVRSGMILGLANDIRRRFNEDNLFASYDTLSYCATNKAIEKSTQKILAWKNDSKKRFEYMEKQFNYLFRLEHLKDSYEDRLAEAHTILYTKGLENYLEIEKNFNEYVKENLKDFDIYLENLLIYYVYTYYCGAVYDGNIYSKIKLSVISIYYMIELFKASFVKNEEITKEDIVEIVYQYSRELEHSDPNLNFLDQLFS